MPNTVYENFVLENKIADMLDTKVDMNAYLTPDRSLTENAGIKKTIHKYTATGNVEDLAQGVGNSGDIEVSFSSEDYVVQVTQGRFTYYDEEAMKDPMVIEVGLKAMSDKMANDLTAKAIEEFGKASLGISGVTWTFANFVDAIAKYPYEDEAGLFCLINPAQLAAIRKQLGTSLSYSEDFVRTGYIGHVCGVPIIVSKAVPDGYAFVASREAVTCFIKKGVEIEQDRTPNTRKNEVFGRKVMLVALTDATRAVIMDAGTYTKTSDQSITSGKTYYTKDDGGAYHAVASPKQAQLSNYYERA
jgi:hypothetical protein